MKCCQVPNCEKNLFARGMCAMHYGRLRIHGSVETPVRPVRTRVRYDGQKFGMLLVRETIHEARADSRVRCLCDCGREHVALAYNVVNGNTSSCGCITIAKPRPDKTAEENEQIRRRSVENAKRIGHANATHGMSKSRTYISWLDARKRCFAPQNKRFHLYGGRGITMCDRWLHSFSDFIADMGEAPAGMTLDRIDVNGNYDPGNCRWATKHEQMQNMRSNVATWESVRAIRQEFRDGASLAELAEKYGMCRNNVDHIVREKSWPEASAPVGDAALRRVLVKVGLLGETA